MARLGDIGKVVTGNTPKTSDSQNYTSNDICFVKPSDIADGIVTYLNDSEFYISEYARAKARILPPQSVLVTCIGIIGKVAINDVECAFNQQINAIIPDNSKCLTEYLAYAIQNKQPEMQDVANAPVVPILNKTQFSDIEINLPSLTEQEEIVEKLNTVSRLIALRKEQLAKSDQLVKSRFIELFGDPVQNPMGWEVVLLKNVTSKIGSGATPKGGKESYQAEGITLIRSMNVHDGRFEYKDLAHITDEQAKQLENVTVEENDVFINITGASVARSCIVPNHILPARVNQHVAIIRCITSMLNPVFANQMFLNTSFKVQLLDIGESGGATRQAITKQQLESLDVVLPPIELQEQFAAFVEQTDKSKLAIQASLDKLELLKKSLMQEYFG